MFARRSLTLGLPLTACLLASAAAQAGPIAIDEYTQLNPVAVSNTIDDTVGVVNAVLSSSILGEQRHVEVTLEAGFTVNMSSAVGLSRFKSAANSGGRIRYVYDGPAGLQGASGTLDPTGLGGIDLSDGGSEDALQLDFARVERQGTLTVTIHTDGSNASSQSIILGQSNSAVSVILPFDNFNTVNGSGADFGNVGAIEVELTVAQGAAEVDVDFDYFQTARSVNATLVDALVEDPGLDMSVHPGDGLEHTAVITNPSDHAGQAVDNLAFSLTADANAPLVLGSVTTTAGSITSGNQVGDTSIEVLIGSLDDGESVTVTYLSYAADPMPLGVPNLINQGAVATPWMTGELTDDPDDATSSWDPTLTPVLYCGSGVVDPGEDCDDAGESATCDADCTPAMCGDMTLNTTSGEECDDGAETMTCDADCSLAVCGDGTLNTTAGEECDGGMETADCDADCTAAACGDGTLNATAGEECDDVGESETCNADCTNHACGDGTLNTTAGEACDDAGESETCNADCTEASCGDGVLNTTAGEACDGAGETADCNADCTAASCGDGILNTTAGEVCDDGNTEDGDGCDSTCQEEMDEETGTDETGTGETGTEETGTGETGMEETGGTGDSGGETGSGSDTSSDGEAGSESGSSGGDEVGSEDGCNCDASGRGGRRMPMLLMLGLVLWRRRKGPDPSAKTRVS